MELEHMLKDGQLFVIFKYEDDEGIEISAEFPAKMEVCDGCQGFGTRLNEAIGSHAYSMEEFDEAFPPHSEERDAYFERGGMFDVQCWTCKGLRVVPVIDQERAAEREPQAFKRYLSDLKSEAEDRAMARAERAMGA
jgi:hypothetical protein